MTGTTDRLRVGIVEPHLLRFGGIRRMVEFANRLYARGHAVTIYLPPEEHLGCTWMPCAVPVRSLSTGVDDSLDVLLVNEETQWHLPALFRHARRRIFYALHHAAVYGKPGSWESARADVDLVLANSTWTADRIAEETGRRPLVVLGGVNPDHFRPVPATKRYPLLCVGDERPWKGTKTIERAAAVLDLPLERYAPKNLPQSRMAEEYAGAEVFVVGSDAEGFGQPGLEALACGVPLVTTDNGGCRDYAIDEETALVVPSGDPHAMAAAIDRVRGDSGLAAHLVANGLRMARERFDWERSTDRLESLLVDLAGPSPSSGARSTPRLRPNLRGAVEEPRLSVVIPTWDQLPYTQACVESIRRNTDVPYELVLVDNGSQPQARSYAEQAGDQVVLNDANRGFAAGMNQGLALARGRYVAFLNNDTELPPGWASRLLEAFDRPDPPGIVVPAVTAAGNQRTVRNAPGDEVEALRPFEAPPSAVLYVMEHQVARELGGWGEEYEVASAEDVDLCFKVWVNGLDVVYDHRVLVAHVGKATSGTKLADWRTQWEHNRRVLFDKWTADDVRVPRLDCCPPEEHARNLQIARSVAGWMERYFAIRRRLLLPVFTERVLKVGRRGAAALSRALYRRRHQATVRRLIGWARNDPRVARARRVLR